MELRPHLDPNPVYSVDWHRNVCRHDLQWARSLTAEQIEERIAAFEANARLCMDERGPGFVDSVGEWRPVPPAVARLTTLAFEGPPHGAPGYIRSDSSKWLLFLDRDGRVVLRIPHYGWNNRDLDPWAHSAGWDTELGLGFFKGDEIAREKAFPGFNRAPVVPVGGPYFVPEPLTARLRKRFRLRRR